MSHEKQDIKQVGTLKIKEGAKSHNKWSVEEVKDKKRIESLKSMISNKATEKLSFHDYQTRVLHLHQAVESKYRQADDKVRVHEK